MVHTWGSDGRVHILMELAPTDLEIMLWKRLERILGLISMGKRLGLSGNMPMLGRALFSTYLDLRELGRGEAALGVMYRGG